MKRAGNIFFYIFIVVFSSAATFLILDLLSDHPMIYDIYPKQAKQDILIDTDIDHDIEDLLLDLETHNAPIDYTSQLDNFCKSDYNICAIITIIDAAKKLTSRNIYSYHVLIWYVLKKVWSYGYTNVLDYLHAIEINNKAHKSRWYASAHSIHLNLWLMWSYTEFYNVFTHEFWHTFDLWYIVWTSKKLDPNYTEFGRKTFAIDDPSIWFYAISRDDEYTLSSDSSYKDFVSWYGMSDVFEDFAETYNFYLNYHDIFVSMADQNPKLKSKYLYMKNLFEWNYFKSGKDRLKTFEDSNYRPYDTTRF